MQIVSYVTLMRAEIYMLRLTSNLTTLSLGLNLRRQQQL